LPRKVVSIMFGQNAAGEYIENKNRKRLLTPEEEHVISRFLTKQMKRILFLLFDNSMTNKEIAEQMDLSTSALSNILQRMKKCEIQLLTLIKEEKYMLYSLTPLAYEYTENYLIAKGKADFKLIQLNHLETAELINCRNNLDLLKERLGESWDIEFFRCCINYYENDGKNVDSEAASFFESVEELIIKEQMKQLELIMNEFGDEATRKLYLKYIQKYIHIRRLCLWDAEEWNLAYRFIDDIFYGEKMCISLEWLTNSGSVSQEDIINIARGL